MDFIEIQWSTCSYKIFIKFCRIPKWCVEYSHNTEHTNLVSEPFVFEILKKNLSTKMCIIPSLLGNSFLHDCTILATSQKIFSL